MFYFSSLPSDGSNIEEFVHDDDVKNLVLQAALKKHDVGNKGSSEARRLAGYAFLTIKLSAMPCS
jgi:hypothetical protein